MDDAKKATDETKTEETAAPDKANNVEMALKAIDEAKETQKAGVTTVLGKKCGITQAQIDDWKAKCGRIKAQSIQDNWFVFRGMSRLEWQDLSDTEAQIEAAVPSEGLKKEMRVVNRCLLFPLKLEIDTPAQAGVASVLFQEILKFSGFEPDMAEAVEL